MSFGERIRRVLTGPYERIPAEWFREPGEHRVVLQVPGRRPVTVLREIRRVTGLSLADAKRMIDDWPAIVVDGVSERSADLVVDHLRRAGANAIRTETGTSL